MAATDELNDKAIQSALKQAKASGRPAKQGEAQADRLAPPALPAEGSFERWRGNGWNTSTRPRSAPAMPIAPASVWRAMCFPGSARGL